MGMWDLLLVPHWWEKKNIVIHPNPNSVKFIFFSTFVSNHKFNQRFLANQSFNMDHLSPFHYTYNLKLTNFSLCILNPKFTNLVFETLWKKPMAQDDTILMFVIVLVLLVDMHPPKLI
jgi:hypothetical protein